MIIGWVMLVIGASGIVLAHRWAPTARAYDETIWSALVLLFSVIVVLGAVFLFWSLT